MPKPEAEVHKDEFERFDEAQPFLQLLADMLNRLINEQTGPEDVPAEGTEEDSGQLVARSDTTLS